MKDLIGFFDSGVGGISVLHEARRLLPNENFYYYGDNANAPYGPRPLDEIRSLSAQVVNELFDRGVKALVIACNTATSAYADILRAQRTDIPIVGMEPALKPAHFARHGGKVIALATNATLRLEKFNRLMDQYGDDVISVVGEGLVELVEAGMADSSQAEAALENLLKPYCSQQIDAVVLGCTHYPFLKKPIQRIFPEAKIFDGREGTAMRLKSLLEQNHLLSDETPGTIEYYSSGGSGYVELMERLMQTLD